MGRNQRLVVIGEDWGRHPSSSQYLVREWLERYDVDWIQTIGTRRPRLNRADLKRGFGKVSDWARGALGDSAAQGRNGMPRHLRVHSPVMWLTFGGRLSRALNAWLLGRALDSVLRADPTPAAVITIIPLVADLARRHAHLNWVYYCVDAFDRWSELDGVTLRRMEDDLLGVVRRVVVSSEALVEHFRARGFDPTVVTHGVDPDLWAKEPGAPAEARSARRLEALFFGHVDERVDVAVCRALLEHCDLVLVGPYDRAPRPLLELAGIRLEPALPPTELAARAQRADVLVLPYVDNDATRAMQPLKLKEYLATGLPVVTSSLPAVTAWSDALDVAADAPEFVARVLERGRTGLPAAQRAARGRLWCETWASKSEAFLQAATQNSHPSLRTTVLHVRCTRGPGGGPEKTILRSAEHLSAAGYRALTAILHDADDPGFEQLAAWAAREHAELVSVPDGGPFDRSLIERLADLCRREQVNVWHGHDYKSNLLGLLVAKRVGLHLVSTAHGWVHRTRRTGLYFALDRWCLRRYDRVIAVSHEVGRACRRFGVPAWKLSVIENAIEADRLVPPEADASQAARDPGVVRVGAVGRLSPEKGFFDLLEAFRRIVADGVRAELAIWGEGEQRAALETWLRRHRLTDSVQLRGFEPDKQRLFGEIDLYVSSSVREGLPNALLEAMAAGRPIVATSVGGVPDAVVHGEHALLCPPSDVDALERELRKLLGDGALRARLGRAARQRALERYAFTERMARVIELYDEVTGKPREWLRPSARGN